MKQSDTIPETELANRSSEHLDQLSTLQFVTLMNQEDFTAVTAVKYALPAIVSAIDAIAERMMHGGRLIYLGAGTSGRLGVLDASEIPPTFDAGPGQVIGIIAGGETALRSAVEGAEDNRLLAQADLEHLCLTQLDSVIGISASGGAAYVLAGVQYAKIKNALAIALVCNPDAPLIASADIAIIAATGPEIISGSTRLKAGTATKMILNMISTGVMIKLGKTYGNLMVDLQALNSKLRTRAVRLVMTICTVDPETAQDALEICSYRVKTTCVHLLKHLSPQDSLNLLEKHNGFLRKALDDEDAL